MTVRIKLFSGILLALVLGQPALAQSLSVTNQAGTANHASTTQSGIGNAAATIQGGLANSAHTVQAGKFNVAATVQVGKGFTHSVTQVGNYQSSTSFQMHAPAGMNRQGLRTRGSALTSATVGFSTQ
jgi:hypothetical protein